MSAASSLPHRPARSVEEITGEYQYTKNVFGSGDDQTIIGVLRDGKIVKGKADSEALEAGLTYLFLGYWSEHPKYGPQFLFNSFTLASPSGHRGVVRYLVRCKGIGGRRAELIWAKYGPDSVKVLRESPEVVAAAIPGLSVDAAREASGFLRSIAATERVTIELTELLAGRNFPRALAGWLIRDFGERAPGAIRDNPYILVRYRGVGFLRTDTLYLQLGKDPAAIERQGRCAWYALHSDSEGHVWFPVAVATDALKKSIAGTDVKPEEALRWAAGESLLVFKEVEGVRWVAESDKAVVEAKLAAYVHQAEVEGAAGDLNGKHFQNASN